MCVHAHVCVHINWRLTPCGFVSYSAHVLFVSFLFLRLVLLHDWKDGSVVTISYCSHRGPKFGS